MIPYVRTTILVPPRTKELIDKHLGLKGTNFTDFTIRALLNQMEAEGDFLVRDVCEEEMNYAKEN